MGRTDLTGFARVETLKSIHPALLRAFLLATGGSLFVELDLSQDPLPYGEIAKRLSGGARSYPTELAEGLYYASDFGRSPNAHEELRKRAVAAGLVRGEDAMSAPSEPAAEASPDEQPRQLSASDLVLTLWRSEDGRKLVGAVHAEHCVANPRMFDSWYPRDDAQPRNADFGGEAIRKLELAIDAHYVGLKRGAGAKVFPSQRPDSIWLIIRKPAPWERRVYFREDGEDDPKSGNPEDYDVLIYAPSRSELCIHTDTKGAADVYRESVGLHSFGDAGWFSRPAAVTLEPLRAAGRRSLDADDIEGIHGITLREVRFDWNNTNKESMTRRAEDLFATFEKYHPPTTPRISYAVFDVAYHAKGAPSAVRIYAGSKASYTREVGHDAVRSWLVERGFLHNRGRFAAWALRGLWEALSRHAGEVYTLEEWGELLGAAAEPSRSVLTLAGGPAPTVACGLAATEGCRRELHAVDDDGVATYRCPHEPTRCNASSLKKSAACGYRLEVAAVAGALAPAVAGAGDVKRMDEPGVELWALGERQIGPTDARFWLAVHTAEADVLRAVSAVRAAAPGVLSYVLLPNCGDLPPRMLGGAVADGVFFAGMDRACSVELAGLAVDLWPFVSRFRDRFGEVEPTEFCGDRFRLVLDPARGRFWHRGRRTLALTPGEAAFLVRLVERGGQSVDIADLSSVAPEQFAPSSRKSLPQMKFRLIEKLCGRKERSRGGAGVAGADDGSATAPEMAEIDEMFVPDDAHGFRFRLPAGESVEWWSKPRWKVPH